MNAQQIDRLITRRNKLTNRRDGWIDWEAVNRIDAQLAQVPTGQRNDVDLLLGRSCAELPVGQAEQRRALQECGAELEDSPADWRDLRGNCAL